MVTLDVIWQGERRGWTCSTNVSMCQFENALLISRMKWGSSELKSRLVNLELGPNNEGQVGLE